MLQAARDHLRLRDDGFLLPDFFHAAMVSFFGAVGNGFCVRASAVSPSPLRGEKEAVLLLHAGKEKISV